MGNAQTKTGGDASHEDLFAKELSKINTIVNAIVTKNDVFQSNDYNFLSQDVCSRNYMLLESDLKKHLKVNISSLGEAMYLIPKDTESKYKFNKTEVCQRITNHYMKILYVLCLIKYVYNIEKHGEFSIYGIIMRNVRVVGDANSRQGAMMEINYCNVAQRDFSKEMKDSYKLDFSKLEGLRFLSEYFLTKEEASPFSKVLRAVLRKTSKGHVKNAIQEYLTACDASSYHIGVLEKVYKTRFNESLSYTKPKKVVDNKPVTILDAEKPHASKLDLQMIVEKENPIFGKDFCSEPHKIVVQTHTQGGRQVYKQYQEMKSNYEKNINEIEGLLNEVVVFDSPSSKYVLRDLDRKALDSLVLKVKDVIKTHYVQSITDYHMLLDAAKMAPYIDTK